MRLSSGMWHKASNYLVPCQRRLTTLRQRMRYLDGEQEREFVKHLEAAFESLRQCVGIAHDRSCELNGAKDGRAGVEVEEPEWEI